MYTVDVFFQTEVVFLHIESVGYAYIAECICTAVLTGLFVLAVRIAYHKAIFCGMFCDPTVLRILFCIIIVRSAVPEIDFQVEAAAAVIIGIAATESGAAVLIAGILICLVPIATEHLHAAKTGFGFKSGHHFVQLGNGFCVQLYFHIADAVGTISFLVDTFQLGIAVGEIVAVFLVDENQIALIDTLCRQRDLLPVFSAGFLGAGCGLGGIGCHVRLCGLFGLICCLFGLLRGCRCHNRIAGILRLLPALAAVEAKCSDQQHDQQQRHEYCCDPVEPEFSLADMTASFGRSFFIHIRFWLRLFGMTDRFFRFAHDCNSFLGIGNPHMTFMGIPYDFFADSAGSLPREMLTTLV